MKLVDLLTESTINTEGLIPGQTPLKDIGLSKGGRKTSMFKDTVQGFPIDWDAHTKAPVDRKNFYFVNPDNVPKVIKKQWQNYFNNPAKYGLSEDSTIEDAVNLFDQENPKNKIKFLNDKGIDTKTTIKDAKQKFDLSMLNPFAVKEASASEKRYQLKDDVGFFKPKMEQIVKPVSQKYKLKDDVGFFQNQPAIKNKFKMAKEAGKGLLRGGENIMAGMGAVTKWLGETLPYAEMATRPLGLPVFKEKRQKALNKIGDKIAEYGDVAYDFWRTESQRGMEAPDPAVFKGSFMQNPSWTRAVAIIAEGIPSLGSATAITFITKNPILGAASLGLIEGADQYVEARRAGKSVPFAGVAGTLSVTGNTILEVLPLTRFLRGGEGKLGKDIFIGAMQEGGEEVLQALWANTIAKIGWDKTRNLAEGMVEGFIAGAGTGGIMGGLTSGRGLKLDVEVKEAVEKGVTLQEIEVMQETVKEQIIAKAEDIEGIIDKNKIAIEDIPTKIPTEQEKAENVESVEEQQGKIVNLETGKELQVGENIQLKNGTILERKSNGFIVYAEDGKSVLSEIYDEPQRAIKKSEESLKLLSGMREVLPEEMVKQKQPLTAAETVKQGGLEGFTFIDKNSVTGVEQEGKVLKDYSPKEDRLILQVGSTKFDVVKSGFIQNKSQSISEYEAAKGAEPEAALIEEAKKFDNENEFVFTTNPMPDGGFISSIQGKEWAKKNDELRAIFQKAHEQPAQAPIVEPEASQEAEIPSEQGKKAVFKISKKADVWRVPVKKPGQALGTKKIDTAKVQQIYQDTLTDIEFSEEGDFVIIKGFPKKELTAKEQKSIERYGSSGVKTTLTESVEPKPPVKEGQGYGTIESSEKSTKERPAKTDYSKIAEEMPKQGFDLIDETLKLVSPASRKEAKPGARIVRKNLAEMAQRQVVVTETLKKAHKAFNFMSKEDSFDFIDRMETGQEQKTAGLEGISKKLREILDGRRTDVQNLGKGQLETFIENYFPHIWKDPKKAKDVIAQIMGRRRIEGTKSFLKQRKIPTVKEGVALGLEPVSDNPIDLVLLKVFEMDRYIMAQNIIRTMRERGLLKFVYSRSQAPQGYTKINDSAFSVFMPPEITKKDYYDQMLVEQMMDIARSLGVDTRRFVSIGGKRLGYAQWYPGETGGEKVRTKFTSPESVLAHEIGHILGYRYDLYNLLGRRMEGETKVHQRGKKAGKEYFKPSKEAVEYRRDIDAQWRALADARKQKKAYARKAREKEAVLLEALIHAPEEFKRVAPDLHRVFTEFLNSTSELRPILDIKPSLVLGENEAKIKIPGFTTLGHFYAPEATGTILNNYLSPGLRNSNNKLIANGYNMLRGAGNVLNQAQLAFSLFHGLNVTSDMAISTFGLGLRKLSIKGQRVQGLKDVFISPIAPFISIWNGTRIKKAYRQSIDTIQDPYLKKMVEAVVAAGGRERMDVFYYNNQIKVLEKTISEIVKGSPIEKTKGIAKLPFNLLGATLESFAKPLMEWYVPTGKLGLFAKMAQHEMQRAEAGQITEDQLWQRLTSVWDSVDNRMGQLVYDNLFWNKYLKDTAMMSIRSVGWNLGSWREFGGAATNILTTKQRLAEGDVWLSHKMAYTIGAVVGYSVLGATIQYLLTGDPPEEPKDYFFPKTGNQNPDGSDERLSLPTYAKDWFAWSHRPIETATHKIHPLWGLLGDLTTNKDFFNVEIRHEDDPILQQGAQFIGHIGKNFKSLSVRNYEKFQKTNPDAWKKNMAVALTGIQPAPAYIARSPAQKLMTRLIVEHIPPVSKTKEEFERSIYRNTLKNRIRKGEVIDEEEAKAVLGDRGYYMAKEEARIPPFADSFKRLSIKDALKVYAIATPEERKQVKDILRGKYDRARDETKTEDLRKLYRELIDSHTDRD